MHESVSQKMKWKILIYLDSSNKEKSAYLVNSSEVSEEALGAAKQGLIVRTNNQVPNVALGAKGI